MSDHFRLTDASIKIQNALSEYVANTTITVKFIDNQVSILGEVQQQGVYSFSQDKLNIYEASGTWRRTDSLREP